MEVGVLTQLLSEQDSCETGHSEVRVSWSESLAGVFVAPKVWCVGTILSMHLPVGFPGRLSSLKTWSFCSFSFPGSVMRPGPGQFWWHLRSHLCSKKRWFWCVLCCAWCGLGTGRCTATLASALLTRGLGPRSQEDSTSLLYHLSHKCGRRRGAPLNLLSPVLPLHRPLFHSFLGVCGREGRRDPSPGSEGHRWGAPWTLVNLPRASFPAQLHTQVWVFAWIRV